MSIANLDGEQVPVKTDGGKATQAYSELERMIVLRELEPGSVVSEAMLMHKTGLGRTPVREALQQLARNQMVEIHPNRGTFVPPISVESQLRMLEVRRELEALAVRLACRRITEAERAEMNEMIDTLQSQSFTLPDYSETVRATHELIASSAHNTYLANALAPLQGLSRRFWTAHVPTDDQDEINTGASMHLAILRAIVAGQADEAEKASLELNDYLLRFSHAAVG